MFSVYLFASIGDLIKKILNQIEMETCSSFYNQDKKKEESKRTVWRGRILSGGDEAAFSGGIGGGWRWSGQPRNDRSLSQ